MKKIIFTILLISLSLGTFAQNGNWYYTHETNQPDELSFEPTKRIKYTVKNSLNIARQDCPVIIKRSEFPMSDLHEMWVTIVDPSLPPYDGPDKEVLKVYGGHQLRAEINGHAIFHQLDDLDKDGIRDELFFQTDLKATKRK